MSIAALATLLAALLIAPSKCTVHICNAHIVTNLLCRLRAVSAHSIDADGQQLE
jgi:hypothetical protein